MARMPSFAKKGAKPPTGDPKSGSKKPAIEIMIPVKPKKGGKK